MEYADDRFVLATSLKQGFGITFRTFNVLSGFLGATGALFIDGRCIAGRTIFCHGFYSFFYHPTVVIISVPTKQYQNWLIHYQI